MKKVISLQKKCKICGNKSLTKVISINEQFISATFVKTNKNNPLANIRTPLTLVLCDIKKNKKACGLLQLLEITKPNLLYKKYFYRSATNDTMRRDLKDVVSKVKSFVKLKKKDIILDIGSNDCTLLNFYNSNYRLVGFEPATNIQYIDKGKKIKVIPTYFNSTDYKKNFSDKAKIITSCAMFYDLEKPKKFVKDIDEILSNDGVWCVQISYLASMIKYNNFYDICHEHLSYYSIETFEKVLEGSDLKLFYAETNHVNGGSIRLFVCKKNNSKYRTKFFINKIDFLKKQENKYKLKKKETFILFQKEIENIKNKTNKFVDSNLKANKKIFGLGASTKGNILLQHFGLNKSKIPYISERNSEKAGLRCLGTDIELITEKKAREKNPAAFLVLPWNFKNEIVKREKEYLNKGGILMFPMPYPHIVTKDGEEKL